MTYFYDWTILGEINYGIIYILEKKTSKWCWIWKKLNAQGFEISRKVFQYPNIYVDDAHKKFAIGDRDKIYDYNHLLDFSGNETTTTVSDK